jgi:hypothetical protein
MSRTEKIQDPLPFMHTTVNTTLGSGGNAAHGIEDQSTYPPGYSPIPPSRDANHLPNPAVKEGTEPQDDSVLSEDNHGIKESGPSDGMDESLSHGSPRHTTPVVFPDVDVLKTPLTNSGVDGSVDPPYEDKAKNPIETRGTQNEDQGPEISIPEAASGERLDRNETMIIDESRSPEALSSHVGAEEDDNLTFEMYEGAEFSNGNESFAAQEQEIRSSSPKIPAAETPFGERLPENSGPTLDETGLDDPLPVDEGISDKIEGLKGDYQTQQVLDDHQSINDLQMDPINWLVPPMIIILTSVILLFRSKRKRRACCCRGHFKDRPVTILSGQVGGVTGTIGTARDSILGVLQKLHDDLLGIRADQQIVDREYLETSSQVLDAIRTQIACTSPGPDEPLRSPSPPTARRIHFPTLTHATEL